MTEKFEDVTVLGHPMLFTCLRVDRDTVPQGMYMYEVRHDDDQQGEPVQIANWIMVNHWGTLISNRPIRLEPGPDGRNAMREMTAAHKIEVLRAEQGNYIEPSFVTIAAYKENAAMCHYHPSDEVCKKLKPEGLLLVDSGGQYLEGTTDITRTYALGPLTEKEKEYYTIVAAAMLKVSTMKFLHGCRGINLDYTIREAFWKRGLDFAHGTGHGVGYLSNVHERPNGLRWKVVPERQDSAVIEPGMICSDEPGLYFAGDFGTRTENLILCVEDEKNEYGQFLKFEFLTKAPIDLEALDTRFMDDADIERLNTYHKDVYETISPYMNDEEKEWLKHVTREISR